MPIVLTIRYETYSTCQTLQGQEERNIVICSSVHIHCQHCLPLKHSENPTLFQTG